MTWYPAVVLVPCALLAVLERMLMLMLTRRFLASHSIYYYYYYYYYYCVRQTNKDTCAVNAPARLNTSVISLPQCYILLFPYLFFNRFCLLLGHPVSRSTRVDARYNCDSEDLAWDYPGV